MGLLLRAAQRRVLRRAVTTDCQVVTDRAFKLLGQRTVDVSDEGLLLPSDVPVELGEEVIVSLRAPGTGLWLDAEAEVVRIVSGRRRRDRGRCLGLRFSYIEGPTAAVLTASLVGRPPPPPSRNLRRDYARSIRRILDPFA